MVWIVWFCVTNTVYHRIQETQHAWSEGVRLGVWRTTSPRWDCSSSRSWSSGLCCSAKPFGLRARLYDGPVGQRAIRAVRAGALPDRSQYVDQAPQPCTWYTCIPHDRLNHGSNRSSGEPPQSSAHIGMICNRPLAPLDPLYAPGSQFDSRLMIRLNGSYHWSAVQPTARAVSDHCSQAVPSMVWNTSSALSPSPPEVFGSLSAAGCEPLSVEFSESSEGAGAATGSGSTTPSRSQSSVHSAPHSSFAHASAAAGSCRCQRNHARVCAGEQAQRVAPAARMVMSFFMRVGLS